MKYIIALIVGVAPATLLYLLMRPAIAASVSATWQEAIIWATALIGTCVAMAVVESVEERMVKKCR